MPATKVKIRKKLAEDADVEGGDGYQHSTVMESSLRVWLEHEDPWELDPGEDGDPVEEPVKSVGEGEPTPEEQKARAEALAAEEKAKAEKLAADKAAADKAKAGSQPQV